MFTVRGCYSGRMPEAVGLFCSFKTLTSSQNIWTFWYWERHCNNTTRASSKRVLFDGVCWRCVSNFISSRDLIKLWLLVFRDTTLPRIVFTGNKHSVEQCNSEMLIVFRRSATISVFKWQNRIWLLTVSVFSQVQKHYYYWNIIVICSFKNGIGSL